MKISIKLISQVYQRNNKRLRLWQFAIEYKDNLLFFRRVYEDFSKIVSVQKHCDQNSVLTNKKKQKLR
ncbi:unnamed protein product [Paramecium sonneborni]|uniref:Uncharacterized protein n=1 Tax=Paramecium sonneborni TaxID=65129 RepID=A0A8S1RTC5_9CILI|nr:unnamed protein product [Paramecium sonneborni]